MVKILPLLKLLRRCWVIDLESLLLQEQELNTEVLVLELQKVLWHRVNTKMPNTEKPSKKVQEKKVVDAPAKPAVPIVNPKKSNEPKANEQTKEVKTEDKKEEKKKPTVKKKIVKKTEVMVRGQSLPISTKYSMAICKFIKRKKIQDAINDLDMVLRMKKAVPMKGEIPHRRGKIMSGRFPQNASKEFVILLRSLIGNANANDIDEPVISLAVANIASRPYGRFGRTRKKRTHVLIKAKSGVKKALEKKKKKKVEKKVKKEEKSNKVKSEDERK